MRKVISLLFIFSLLCFISFAQNTSLQGFGKAATETQFAAEKKFDASLRTDNIDKLIKDLSALPHHVGSAADAANAQYILNKFKSWGYDAQIETFYVLFPTPKTRLLEMTGSKYFKAALSEPALKEDATSGQKKDQLPTYNCFSPDGDVTAELVFVNYGVPADYEKLARMGIDVKGKIVIAKYGQSWRGIKPKVAQEARRPPGDRARLGKLRRRLGDRRGQAAQDRSHSDPDRLRRATRSGAGRLVERRAVHLERHHQRRARAQRRLDCGGPRRPELR